MYFAVIAVVAKWGECVNSLSDQVTPLPPLLCSLLNEIYIRFAPQPNHKGKPVVRSHKITFTMHNYRYFIGERSNASSLQAITISECLCWQMGQYN